MRKLFLALVLNFSLFPVFAQSNKVITGNLKNIEHKTIIGATVIVQNIDSTYVGAAVTDNKGSFELEVTNLRLPFIVILQHVNYKIKKIESTSINVGDITMDESIMLVSDVTITSKQSIVKVDNGKLDYNVQLLTKNKPVNNAYEAIAELPGIVEMNGELSLAGASGFTIIINGKPTTMSKEQLKTLLKNTPVDRIKKAEVMYSTPPEYHVRGASVNLVLTRSTVNSFQGQVKAGYKNQYFNGGDIGTNLRFTTPKYAIDFMYDFSNSRDFSSMDMVSNHTLNDKVYFINQLQKIDSDSFNHNVRAAFEYNISDKSSFDISYTSAILPKYVTSSHTIGNFQTSENNTIGNNQMHNISTYYNSDFGFKLGMDYTYYRINSNQNLESVILPIDTVRYNILGGQTINRYSVFADQTHSLSKGWNIGYGAIYTYANDMNFQKYKPAPGETLPNDTNSKLDEHIGNLYFNLSKSFSDKTNFSISATGEYYTIGDYKKWSIYPQATFMHMISQDHIFQASLSSDKTYPSYWDLLSSVTYLDGYSEVHGTPGLLPMTNYSFNGTYILKQKYVFSLFYSHTQDYFTQTSYQSPDRLALIFKTQNFDFSQQYGVSVMIPFKIKKWLDSRLTLVGFSLRQKSDNYYDMPFNRQKFSGITMLDNTFNVTKNLSFDLSFMYHSPIIQGTYDTGHIMNLSAGGKWTFLKGNADLIVRCNDILNTSNPAAWVNYGGQDISIGQGLHTRSITVSFVYRFSDYKNKAHKKVNTSRFGH